VLFVTDLVYTLFYTIQLTAHIAEIRFTVEVVIIQVITQSTIQLSMDWFWCFKYLQSCLLLKYQTAKYAVCC
jgi:hypothetical protein